MYLVGKIVRAHGTTVAPQWSVVAVRRTMKRALQDCLSNPSPDLFYVKLKFGIADPDSPQIFPRRPS